jgi:hypothetical protein
MEFLSPFMPDLKDKNLVMQR